MKMFLTKAIILKANKVICLFPLKKKVRLLTMYLKLVIFSAELTGQLLVPLDKISN